MAGGRRVTVTGRLSIVVPAYNKSDPRVSVLDLSRNFGKEISLTAGLDHARGDVAIPTDADLQDPQEVIEQLVEKWQEGFDMVCATRRIRSGES
jgi:glycosyltransferase involved in cell wall biosynthesis